MMQESVYDLCTCKPHEPPGRRFTNLEYDLYREGYQFGVLMALRVMEAARERHALYRRTRRLEARKKRHATRSD